MRALVSALVSAPVPLQEPVPRPPGQQVPRGQQVPLGPRGPQGPVHAPAVPSSAEAVAEPARRPPAEPEA